MTTPETLPEEMTLWPSRLKWGMVSLIGLVFVAGGLLMIVDENSFTAWASTMFFAIVALTGLFQLFGGQTYLKLDLDGFEQSMMGRKLVCRWDEVSEFHSWRVGTNSFVGFSRAQDAGQKLAAVNRALTGASGSLGDTFGMKADKLAQLMNAFRARALQKQNETAFH